MHRVKALILCLRSPLLCGTILASTLCPGVAADAVEPPAAAEASFDAQNMTLDLVIRLLPSSSSLVEVHVNVTEWPPKCNPNCREE